MIPAAIKLDLIRKAHSNRGPDVVVSGDGIGVVFRRRSERMAESWHPSAFGYTLDDADRLVDQGFLERRTSAPDQEVSYAITVAGFKAIGAWPAGADDALARARRMRGGHLMDS